MRIVTEMIENLDLKSRAQFYKCMLTDNQKGNAYIELVENQMKNDNGHDNLPGILNAEYILINDIANSMDELNNLLVLEELLSNP